LLGVHMESMRVLLGDSLYEWTVQLGQMLDWLWNSLLVWRILALVLFIWLVSQRCRRP